MELDRTVILYNDRDNPPNGPREKALNGRLIVTHVNDVGSASVRVESGSSSGYRAGRPRSIQIPLPRVAQPVLSRNELLQMAE